MPDGEVNFTVNTTDGPVSELTYTRDQLLNTLGHLQYSGGNVRNLDNFTTANAGSTAYDSSGNIMSRSVVGGDGVTVTNGDGVSANPEVSLERPILVTPTADRTLQPNETICVVNTTSASPSLTVTLPDASSMTGRTVTVVRSNRVGGTLIVAASASATIRYSGDTSGGAGNSGSTRSLTDQYASLHLISDGTNWYTL